MEFGIKLNSPKITRQGEKKKDFDDFEMMNRTSSRTIKPKRGLTCIFKYWNRERFFTVVVLFTTENPKQQQKKKILGKFVDERLRVK